MAGPSTIFASMFFHCALNAAMPSGVIRSTTWFGGSDDGITGGGGAGAATGAGGGPCATVTAEIVREPAARAAHAAKMPGFLVCIFFSSSCDS